MKLVFVSFLCFDGRVVSHSGVKIGVCVMRILRIDVRVVGH